MKKSREKNTVASIAAFATLAVVWKSIKRMIKKYHKKQEVFFN